jgi:potassium channel subfamily K, other eukaryote
MAGVVPHPPSMCSQNSLSVGYGDLCPSTRQGQIFTIFFAMYGIAILGIFLGILGDMMVERHQKQQKGTMQIARQKYLQTFQHGMYQPGTHPRLVPTDEEGSSEESGCRQLKKGFKTFFYVFLDQLWILLILIAVAVPVILIEEWSIVKGVYWMVITGTTIGLGDETPTHPVSKGLCILYIPLAVYSVGRFLGLIATTFLDRRSSKAEEKFLNRALTLSDIKRMDLDNQGGVSREEFLVYMLVTLQKVDEEDISDIIDTFQKLDTTGDGVLTSEDLVAGFRRTQRLSTSSRSWTSTR